jgi:hyperosmotically inducible protein
MLRILATIVLAGAAAAALAQAPAEPLMPQQAEFLQLDRTRDGYLSRVEAAADREIAKRFSAFDLDGDGQLSEGEFALAKDDIARRVVHDTTITARVKAALLATEGVRTVSISVQTYEGRVQLSGLVPSAELASRAGRVTASVSGVRTVSNNITAR